MSRDLDPRAMSVLDDEEGEYLAQTSYSAKTRRIQIPKGHEWLVRFLPVELGAARTPWARFGFHWINKRPYMCVRHTSPHFGGVKDGECQLCNVADQLNEDSDRSVSTIGYRARAVPQWLMYALVLEKNDGRHSDEVRGDDLWNPWEFWLHRSPFDEIHLMHKKRQQKIPLGILDIDEGCSIWVRSAKQGFKFDRQDPSPLMTDDPAKRQALLDRIWAKIKFKQNKPPTRDEMDDLVDKLREAAERGSFSDDRQSSRRRGADDYYEDDDRPARRDDDDRPRRRDDDDDDRPARRPVSDDRPVRRSVSDDDDRPARRVQEDRDDDRPVRRAVDEDRPARRRDEDDDRPARRDESRLRDTGDDSDLAPRPVSRAVAPPPAARTVAPPPARRVETPAPAAAPVRPSVDPEEDNAPEERLDHAPAAGEIQADDAPVEPEAPPAPVSRPPSSLSARIRNGIAAANNR